MLDDKALMSIIQKSIVEQANKQGLQKRGDCKEEVEEGDKQCGFVMVEEFIVEQGREHKRAVCCYHETLQ